MLAPLRGFDCWLDFQTYHKMELSWSRKLGRMVVMDGKEEEEEDVLTLYQLLHFHTLLLLAAEFSDEEINFRAVALLPSDMATTFTS